MTLRPVHTIRLQGSDSWFKKLDSGVQTVRFQDSVFVGSFHLSRRIESLCRKVILTVLKRSDFWNKKNRILEIGSCERAFTECFISFVIGNPDYCGGDILLDTVTNGAPLTTKREGKTILIGLKSLGSTYSCTSGDVSHIFANIGHLRTWISTAIASKRRG